MDTTLRRILNYDYLHYFCLFYIPSLAFLTNIGIKGNCLNLYLPELIFLLFIPFILLQRHFFFKNLHKIDYLLLIYAVWNLITSIYSNESSSIIESIGKIYLIVVYFLYKEYLIHNQFIKRLNNLLKSFYFLFVILLFLGIAGWLVAYLGYSKIGVYIYPNYPYFGTVYRLQGLTGTPTMYISILTCCLILCGDYLFGSKSSKLLLVGAFCCILLTFSKSILLLGVALIFSYFSSLNFKIRITMTFLIAFLFFLTTNFYFAKGTTMLNTSVINPVALFQVGDISIHETIYWSRKKVLVQQILDYPIFGLGVGNSNQQLISQDYGHIYSKEFDKNCDPNCTYLGVFAELGFIGVLICCFVLLEFMIILKRLSYIHELGWALVICFLIGSIEAMNTDMLNFRHYWVILGISVGMFVNKKQET